MKQQYLPQCNTESESLLKTIKSCLTEKYSALLQFLNLNLNKLKLIKKFSSSGTSATFQVPKSHMLQRTTTEGDSLN